MGWLLVRREAHRLVRLLYPHARGLRTIIHRNVDDHATASARRRSNRIDLVRFDDSPLATRSPIAIKLVEGILLVAIRMLPPFRIVHPDRISRIVALLLQRVEK